MIPVTINGFKISIPTQWREVTIEKFIEIIRGGGFLKILSILTGFSYQELSQSKQVNLDTELEKYLGFLKHINPDEWKVPEYFTVNGRKLKVPTNLDFETLGQKIMYLQEEQTELQRQKTVGNEDVDMTQLIIPILSIYFQPLYHEDVFDDERVEDMYELIKQTSCVEAWPIAFFLFRKYSALKNIMPLSLPRTKRYRLIIWLRGLALKSYKKLDHLGFLIRLQEEQYSDGTKP